MDKPLESLWILDESPDPFKTGGLDKFRGALPPARHKIKGPAHADRPLNTNTLQIFSVIVDPEFLFRGAEGHEQKIRPKILDSPQHRTIVGLVKGIGPVRRNVSGHVDAVPIF